MTERNFSAIFLRVTSAQNSTQKLRSSSKRIVQDDWLRLGKSAVRGYAKMVLRDDGETVLNDFTETGYALDGSAYYPLCFLISP